MGKSCAAVHEADPGDGSADTAGSTPELDVEQRWLESFAFATSPYGLGINARDSWEYTPREFQAFEKVYERHLEHEAQKRADFFNANFKHPNHGEHWDATDFMGTRTARAARNEKERERKDIEAFRIAEAQQIREMRAGRFDESLLPAWARMTDQEKRERGVR